MIQRWLYGAPPDTKSEDWLDSIGMWPDEKGAYVLYAEYVAEMQRVKGVLRDIRMSNAGTEQRKRGWDTALAILSEED